MYAARKIVLYLRNTQNRIRLTMTGKTQHRINSIFLEKKYQQDAKDRIVWAREVCGDEPDRSKKRALVCVLWDLAPHWGFVGLAVGRRKVLCFVPADDEAAVELLALVIQATHSEKAI